MSSMQLNHGCTALLGGVNLVFLWFWYFFLELFRQCGIFGFSFHCIAWFVLSSMVCVVQHGMYCPAWYVLSSMVCIVQNGTVLENTYHAGKYIPCWTIHTMLDNTYHAGKNIPCWKMHTMLDNAYHAGQYITWFNPTICFFYWSAYTNSRKASSHVFVARFIDFASIYDFDIFQQDLSFLS
jgi:hypothetical protein